MQHIGSIGATRDPKAVFGRVAEGGSMTGVRPGPCRSHSSVHHHSHTHQHTYASSLVLVRKVSVASAPFCQRCKFVNAEGREASGFFPFLLVWTPIGRHSLRASINISSLFRATVSLLSTN
jgi:hypothetical protein